MTIKSIKTELYKLIDDIEDKHLLNLIKNEIQLYTSHPQTDILESLTQSQQQQLQLSIEEAEKKEVVSLKGYQKLTERWRIR